MMESEALGMTMAGWIFLVVAWGAIFGLVGFCFRRIFSDRVSFGDEESDR